jgi:hypothetical protein
MKSSMHNETKQIKAKKMLFNIYNATKKETTQECPRHYHEKLCTFGTKQARVKNNDTTLTMQRKTTQHQKLFCEKNCK